MTVALRDPIIGAPVVAEPDGTPTLDYGTGRRCWACGCAVSRYAEPVEDVGVSTCFLCRDLVPEGWEPELDAGRWVAEPGAEARLLRAAFLALHDQSVPAAPSKVCSTCREKKPLSCYYLKKGKKGDGRVARCADCEGRAARLRRYGTPEYRTPEERRGQLADAREQRLAGILAYQARKRAERIAAAAGVGITSKVCTVCLADLPLDDFYEDERYWLGRRAACKPCLRAQGVARIARQRAEAIAA